MELKVPSTITVPGDSTSGFIFNCNFCTTISTGTLAWDSATRIMKISNVFPTSVDYTYKGTALSFSIKGWTNPSDTTSAEFTWESYATISGVNYLIDKSAGMYITSTLGVLYVNKIYPSDGNYRIYGRPENYTFEIATKSGFKTDYELVI